MSENFFLSLNKGLACNRSKRSNMHNQAANHHLYTILINDKCTRLSRGSKWITKDVIKFLDFMVKIVGSFSEHLLTAGRVGFFFFFKVPLGNYWHKITANFNMAFSLYQGHH
jgi:hypothetical protein